MANKRMNNKQQSFPAKSSGSVPSSFHTSWQRWRHFFLLHLQARRNFAWDGEMVKNSGQVSHRRCDVNYLD
jgi:hypothetical protein